MDHELIDVLATRAKETGSDMDFEVLYRAMMPVLRGISNRWKKIRGISVEDLEQEFGMVMLNTLRTWTPGGTTYERYLSSACYNRALTAYKHARNLKNSFLNSAVSMNNPMPGGDEHDIPAPATMGEGSADAMEVGELVHAFLASTLTRVEALCMTLWSMGYGITEISVILKRPYKQVDNCMTRARRKFAQARTEFDPGLPMADALMGWIDGQ